MTLTRRSSLVTFATLTLLLLAVEAWIATYSDTSRQPGVMAIAITADLTVGVSLLYYLLVVRKRFLPLLSIVSVFVVMLFVVRFILPSSRQSYLGFIEFLIPAIEFSLAVFVLFKLRGIIGDVRSAMRESLYFIDAYPVYQWLPQDRHVVGKGAAVNWDEGLHSVWRSKLNRLVRRTKGYTKSVEMLVYSLALLCWRQWLKSYSRTC